MRIYTILGLLIISCALAQNQTECPKYTCETLDDGVCANKTDSEILVNENGCPNGQGCRYSAMAEWAETVNQTSPFMCENLATVGREGSLRFLQVENNTATNITTPGASSTLVNITTNATAAEPPAEEPTTVPANITSNVTTTSNVTSIPTNVTAPTNVTMPVVSGLNVTTNETAITTGFNCGSRNTQKDLDSGSYPKECKDTSDCALKDGSSAPCICAPDGKRYCQPDRNSEEFDDYWKMCEDGSMTNELYNNWTILVENYVYLIGHPDCFEQLFPYIRTAAIAAKAAGVDQEDNYSILLGLSGLIWVILLS